MREHRQRRRGVCALQPHWFHRTATSESDVNQIWSIVFPFLKPERKSMIMRNFTASVIVAALSIGTPALVQAQKASQPGTESQSDQSKTVIRSIEVVDVKELQPAVRAKVDEIVAHTSDEDIQSLRKSIDATPQAASVLKAKGLNSSQVVAINIADGVLTMFTKTA
jgi:hypothetical protein